MYFDCIKGIEVSGINDVSADIELEGAPVEVYDLNGVKFADTVKNLPSGLDIVRQGNKAVKVAVK